MKRNKVSILFYALLTTIHVSASSSWRPIVPHSSSLLHQEAAIYDEDDASSFELDESIFPQVHPLAQQEQDQCALYKVSMSQQLYFEYIHYKMDMPDLKEFTLCMWTKFYNHTNDHPLFSYAVGDQPKGILSWVANTARSSYYMLNVDGHNLYRLNYPLRLNKWYHSCQSWNGRTGEWQIWVNDERVGRGFHNRLVGHVVKGNGIAISGQQQRQLGGGFLEGEDAPQGSGGYVGELTMVQMYSVALTAGKAHKDHKHHHAHHYEHDTSNNTPRPTQQPVTGPPLPMNPYLTGGQINHRVKVNPGAQLQFTQNGVTLRHPSLPVPDSSALQPFPPANPDVLSVPSSLSGLPTFAGTTQYFGNQVPQIPQLSQVGTGDDADGFGYINNQYHELFKREKNVAKRQSDDEEKKKKQKKKEEGRKEEEEEEAKENKEEIEKVSEESVDSEKSLSKREARDIDDKVSFVPTKKVDTSEKSPPTKRESDKKKRGLIQLADGSVLDDTFLVPQGLDNNYFSGLASFGLQLPTHAIKDEEREPAEAEVRQIMDVCDGCAEEPFEKALVMGWRTVSKKLYSGALYLPAAQTCKGF